MTKPPSNAQDDLETHPILRELERIDAQLDELPASQRREEVRILIRAVELSEQLDDPQRSFNYLYNLMRAAYYSDELHLMFTYFPRFISIYDTHSEQLSWISNYKVFSKYKWIISNSLDYPQIPLTRLEALCDDLEARLRADHLHLRSSLSLRVLIAMSAGRYEEIPNLIERQLSEQREIFDDCSTCEELRIIIAYLRIGERERGIERFERLFARGEQCHSQPMASYGELARAYLERGDVERAAELCRHGWPQIQEFSKRGHGFQGYVSYFAHRGDLELVVQGLTASLPDLFDETTSPGVLAHDLASVVYCIDQLLRAGHTHLSLSRVETSLTSAWEDQGLNLSVAREDFAREVERIGASFDQRNGNQELSKRLGRLLSGEAFSARDATSI